MCLSDKTQHETAKAQEGIRRRNAPSVDVDSKLTTASTVDHPAKLVWSSLVAFYPPSNKYWRIGGKWYDFSNFNHPGGNQILELARDRFEDSTFVFEAHHHDYQKARKIIQKYLVPDECVLHCNQSNGDIDTERVLVAARPSRRQNPKSYNGNDEPNHVHFDKHLEAHKYPALTNDDAFYSVLRRRVAAYLRTVGCPGGEPTWLCVLSFWFTFVAWAAVTTLTWYKGSLVFAIVSGFVGSFLGAFGHNWVHMPKYKDWGWALLSLDTVGFSSEAWFREHVLQHHMYTNTPWDNHFRGTDPFLKTDPTVSRNVLQEKLAPAVLHIILCFGVYGNYAAHLGFLLQGQEVLSVGKIFFPLLHYLFWARWGWYGLALYFTVNAVLGNFYFTIALMNHNSAHSHDVAQRNKSCDWGEAQLHSSTDWSVHLSFLQSFVFLMLNFHTVHHRKFANEGKRKNFRIIIWTN